MKTDLINDLGGPAVVARMTGRRVPTVIEWRHRGAVPPMAAPLIELHTRGDRSVEDICPGTPWERVPDAGWPHPGGRPVIAPVSSAQARELIANTTLSAAAAATEGVAA